MAEPLAEKVVQPAINTEHVAYCPTMDLIALATIDGQTHVFRLNGQRVFGVLNKQPSGKVSQIRWKPNGQLLAVALNGHELGLTNSHTGKLVHQIDCNKYSKSPICCLGWGITFTESSALGLQLQDSKAHVTLDDVISRNPQIKSIESPPDLPVDLAFLDVEMSLPKLSPLSSGGIEDDIFGSRASIDSIFQPLITGSTDSADILIVGFEDGTVHLSIYDFFEIGSFQLSPLSRDAQVCKPLIHSSHPLSTTHTLLVAGGEDLRLVPFDLRLISNAGRYLSSLASKSTQLQNILRYLRQVQRQLYGDFKSSQDLSRRFMSNVEEALQKNSDCTWEQAAYHLVVTGNCYPEVKDWLVDQLGDRGHKRWEKAVTAGYESVLRLVHEHLLPALERFTVLVSRLRGLSRFQLSNATTGLSTQDLNNTLDTINCLQLVAHHVLIVANSELHQFQAFSSWLHEEIGAQSGDASASEDPEKNPDVNHAGTLGFIQGAMTQSQLTPFLQSQTDGSESIPFDLTAEGRSLFDLYKREINHKHSGHASKRLPGVDLLLDHLDSLCTIIFTKIGETQRRNVRFGPSISLGSGVPKCMDIRMILENLEITSQVTLYVAVGPRPRQAIVGIYRVTMEIKNGMSSTKGVERAVLRLEDWNVNDIKFVDDDDLMLAASNNSSSRLFRLRYRKDAGTDHALEYRQADKSQDGTCSIDFESDEQASRHTWLELPTEVSWAPGRIEINGRKGRRVVGVFSQDSLHYRVYDLDSFFEADEDAKEAASDTVMT